MKFVGREAQLDRLSLVFAKGQPSKTAIVGLGGVGKTQVILEFVYRTRERYPDCSICWLPATNVESLQQAYLEAGQQLDISGINEEQANVKKLVQDRLSQDSTGRWLLIFDNADDIGMWIKKDRYGNGFPALKQYLPRSSQGRIIFTTRSRKVAVKLAQENLIEILEMGEEIARLLLSKSLITQNLRSSDQDTLELLQQLTFLPLAIVQAAAYVDENGLTFSDYSSLLKSQEQDVIDLLSEDFEDEGQYRGKKNPIATTWLISFEHIRQLDPLAAENMSFMCCIHPRDIPESLLPPAQSHMKAIDAIGTLTAYSFVSRRSADSSLDLHRLVHLATRNWLRKEDSLAKCTLKVVVRLGNLLPSEDLDHPSLWRTYLPHLQYVFESIFIEDEIEVKLEFFVVFGLCLLCDGRYNEAEKCFLPLIETTTRLLGEEHPNTLASSSFLALIYTHQERWEEAEELELQVLETRKRVYGNEHPDTLRSMHKLALAYNDQGRWKEAEEFGIQIMETRERELGIENPDTLRSISHLTATYMSHGEWKEAEELEDRVMKTRERVLGKEHPDTMRSIRNLATIYSGQGREEKAEELERQLLETSTRVLGEEHPDTLTRMKDLAYTWKSLGRVTEASQLIEKCFELQNQKFGADHYDTRHSRETLLHWKA